MAISMIEAMEAKESEIWAKDKKKYLFILLGLLLGSGFTIFILKRKKA